MINVYWSRLLHYRFHTSCTASTQLDMSNTQTKTLTHKHINTQPNTMSDGNSMLVEIMARQWKTTRRNVKIHIRLKACKNKLSIFNYPFINIGQTVWMLNFQGFNLYTKWQLLPVRIHCKLMRFHKSSKFINNKYGNH